MELNLTSVWRLTRAAVPRMRDGGVILNMSSIKAYQPSGGSGAYAVAKAVTSNFLVKLILLGLIWLYMHHFCAGIRYLLLDLHKGIELEAARFSSKVVFAVSITLTVIIGAKVLL